MSSDRISLDTFAKSFKNERLLQHAIAELLSRMENVTGVQILQGTLELGKDIVFFTPGGFGERQLNACVVKNTRLTGDCASSQGARTVLVQAQQAFDTPHLDDNGNEIRVTRVYVITPFPIPPATANSIAGALRERAGQVQFIGGPTLFEQFKQHWPDFLAEEYRILESYAESMRAGVESDRDLEGLTLKYQLGTLDKGNLRRTYVRSSFHKFIRCFSTTPLYRKTAPKPFGDFQGQAELNDWRDGLTRIREFFRILPRWNLCEPKPSQQVGTECNAIIANLEKAWSTAWAGRIASRRPGRFQKDTAEIHLPNRLDLNASLAQLGITVARTVKPLEDRLSELCRSVQTHIAGVEEADLHSTSQALSDALHDLTRVLGPGFVEQDDEARFEWDDGLIEQIRGALLVMAPAGYGKSSLCRWHALNDLEALLAGRSRVLPVYVPLHQVGTIAKTTFEAAFLKYAGVSALMPQDLESGRDYDIVRAYLDGLDEVPTETERRAIVDCVRSAIASDTNLQVIITARDYVFGPWLAGMPRVYLSGLNDQQIRELVEKWLRKPEQLVSFFNQLEGSPSLKQMMTTPLLATLIILVFRQTGKLPENRTRLYDIFIDLHGGGWDLAKGIQRESSFSSAQKMFFLKRFAFDLQRADRRETLSERAAELAKELLANVDWLRFKAELLRDGLLSEAGDMLGLSHQSYQEFLCARELLGQPDGTELNRIADLYILGADWWTEVLRFYVDLSGKTTEIEDWLNKRLQACRKTASAISHQGMVNRVSVILQHVQSTFSFARIPPRRV